jgi:DNA segregation ATPase FtsK/SpoIIIE, S-DNA-T family
VICCLCLETCPNLVRLQSAFISEKEVKRLVDWLIEHNEQSGESLELEEKSGAQTFLESLESDESNENLDDMYEEAKDTVVRAGKASTSYIQRKLSIGYARAARIMDQLEENGIIGPENGSKPRDIVGGNSVSNANDIKEE